MLCELGALLDDFRMLQNLRIFRLSRFSLERHYSFAVAVSFRQRENNIALSDLARIKWRRQQPGYLS